MLRLLFFLLISAELFGQNSSDTCSFTIKGKVWDHHDKSPLAFTEIFIEELNIGVVSDSTGYFEIRHLCAGNYNLVCKHVGCDNALTQVKLKGNVEIQIEMEHHWEEINTIEISAKKIKEEPTQPRTTLTEEQRDKQRGKTLADALQEISGVQTLRSGNDIVKPVVHGMSGNRVLLLNNQTRQEDQQWGVEHAPNIDPFAIDKISLVKGAAAVQYGSDALGGVILLEPTHTPHQLEGSITTQAATNGRGGVTSAYIKGNIRQKNKWFYKVQSTLKRHGDYRAPKYFLSNTGQKEQAASAYIHYTTWRHTFKAYYSIYHTEIGILRAAHIGNTTDLENAIKSDRPLFIYDFSYKLNRPKQEVKHHLFNLEYQYKFKNGNRLEWLYAFQSNNRKEFDIRRNSGDKRPAVNMNLNTQNFDFSYQIIKSHQQKKMGFQAQHQFNDNVSGTGFRPIIPNYDAFNIGFYFFEKHEINKWHIEWGTRYDYKYLNAKKLDRQNRILNTTFNFHNAAVFFGTGYKFHSKFQIRSNIATAFRPPNVAELLSEGIHQSIASIEEGNLSLKTERSIKWVSTIDFKSKNDIFSIQVIPYISYIDDYIFLQPQAESRLTIRGAFPVFNYQKTNAAIMGNDVDMTFSFHKNITLQQQTSLVYGRDISENTDLIFMPPVQFKQNLRYDFKWSALKSFIQIENIVVLRQKWFPKGVDFIPPPPSYSLFNLYAGITLPSEKQNWDISIQVDNLLDKAYRDYLNRFRYFVDHTGINFTIKLKYFFFKP